MEDLSAESITPEAAATWSGKPIWYLDPGWGTLHLVADFAIWGACLAIPLVVLHFLRRRRDFPFRWVLYLFAGLVLAFGLTHLLEASQYYWPAARWLAVLKCGTAVAAWATVAALFPVIPKILAFRSPEEAEREVSRRTAELSEMADRLKREVAAREAINHELRERRQMSQLALTAAEAGSFNWDLRSNIVVFDQAQVHLTGLGMAEGRIRPSEFLVRIGHGFGHKVRRAVRQAIDRDQRFDVRFPFVKPDGTPIWLAAHGCVIRDATGRPLRLIGLNQDITELVERETELDEAAKEAVSASRHKSRFIAQVSHEIRTPLTAMLGCIDTLTPELPAGTPRQTLRTVRSQGEMLRILLNDVLDLSRIEAGKLAIRREPTSIASVIAGVCSLMEPLARDKGLELLRQAESPLPARFRGDPHRIRQVMLNLVGNAIKFTRTGSVTIVSRVEPDPSGVAGTLHLEVRDTGVGIPRKSLARIFREFEQAGKQRDGTGLGLAICSRLVGMMGGRITARSEVGIGSAFRIELPIEDLEAARLVDPDDISDATAEPRRDPGGVDEVSPLPAKLPLKVLAAEDTPAIQFVIERMVGKMVQNLHVVGNGAEAVESVMAAEASGEPFDLVVMDIQMPEVSGVEATRQLRREGFRRPIVALTAGTMEEEQRECMTAGCTHFLSKPIDFDAFRGLLERLTPTFAADAPNP